MQPESLAGDRIVTGEAVALELRAAGIGSRGVAVVLDFAAQLLLTMGWLWLATSTGGSLDSAGASALLLSLLVLTVLGYPVLFETLWRGRTPGKAAMGLRVVRDDGGPIRFRHAFVRGLVGVVVDRPGISSGLLALIPMLMTARSKRLGDLAAGTIVVQERVPSRALPAPTVHPALAGWAAGLDLSGFDDRLALEVRQFLGRAHQLAPWARDEMGGRLLHEATRRVGPPPAGMDPWTYLMTLLAERSRREAARLAMPPSPPPASYPHRPAEPPPPASPPPPPMSPGPFAPPG